MEGLCPPSLDSEHDVVCEECKGARVVAVPDEESCPTNLLAMYNGKRDDDAEVSRAAAYQRKMGWPVEVRIPPLGQDVLDPLLPRLERLGHRWITHTRLALHLSPAWTSSSRRQRTSTVSAAGYS